MRKLRLPSGKLEDYNYIRESGGGLLRMAATTCGGGQWWRTMVEAEGAVEIVAMNVMCQGSFVQYVRPEEGGRGKGGVCSHQPAGILQYFVFAYS